MSPLSFLIEKGLWKWLILTHVSAILAGCVILHMVRVLRKAQIHRLPLVEQQTVEFSEADKVVLSVEGPRLTTRFIGLDYSLTTDYHTAVEGRATWFGATSTGVSRMRQEVRSYQIPHPGRYVLHVRKLGGARNRDAEHRLVFTRPHLARIVACVIGIVITAGLSIAGLVLFVLGIRENQPGG